MRLALLLLACVASVVAGRAHALDQGEALSSCLAGMQAAAQTGCNVGAPVGVVMTTEAVSCKEVVGQARYAAYGSCRAPAGHITQGPNAGPWGSFPYTSSCASRQATYPPGDATGSAVPVPRCYGGCEVLGIETKYAVGGISLYGMKERYYSGATCTARVDANAPIDAAADQRTEATQESQAECTAVGGGQTACLKPNGDYCATASNGKTHCWTPTEEGVKVDGEDAQRKSETGKPVTPPDVSIPDKDWQRKEGHQAQACVNDTCKTYNVTNYVTVPAGTAKNSTGDNSADGTGNTSGNGATTKPGESDDGEGDSASESGNCEAPPVCTGDTLKCLHLKITWRIDCNTKGNEITDSNGCGAGDVPVCAGKNCKTETYSLLLRDWRRRCEFVADAESGVADGQGDDEAGVIGGLWNSDGQPEPQFDTGKVSVGGGGDLIPQVQIYGTTFTVPPSWYDLIAKIRLLVIASFMVAAFWVLARI